MNMDEVVPARYTAQLDAKQQALSAMLQPFSAPALDVFKSVPEHYRLRAEFRIWHEGDDLFYAMFEPGNKRQPIRIDACPMVAKPIHDVMFDLLAAIKAEPELSRKLFQIDFLSTLASADDGDLLVTLLYHRPIGDDWEAHARALQTRFGIHIIGRSRKTKLVLERDFVLEKLQLDGRDLTYKQVENSFTQPNGSVAVQMLEWARDVSQSAEGDLLELYCGNANFSIALSDRFKRILATEISKSSVNSALYNIEANQVENLQVVRLSSEEFTEAMNGVREFRRLKEQQIDLTDYDFSTVLVDPPRAGLDAGTVELIQHYDHILYISCNPTTLCENLQSLNQTHRIERAALFDQFPYTEHMEAGVWLVRR